jgi:hypothetical protein
VPDKPSIVGYKVRFNTPSEYAAVALANKTARIAWAMLSKSTDYHPMAV